MTALQRRCPQFGVSEASSLDQPVRSRLFLCLFNISQDFCTLWTFEWLLHGFIIFINKHIPGPLLADMGREGGERGAQRLCQIQ
jgi:hypothetical protein